MSIHDKVELIRSAILNRSQVVAIYDDRRREFCPHSLGRDVAGEWTVHAVQFGGETSPTAQLPGWRFFELNRLNEISLRDGQWYRGEVLAGGPQQTKIRHLDLVVDEAYRAQVVGVYVRPASSPLGGGGKRR